MKDRVFHVYKNDGTNDVTSYAPRRSNSEKLSLSTDELIMEDAIRSGMFGTY